MPIKRYAPPPTVNYPPLPVAIVQVVTNGNCAAAGSNNRKTAIISHWQRLITTPVFTKSAFDTAYQAAIVVPIAAALNARWTQLNNAVRVVNNWLDQPQKFGHAAVGAIGGDSMPTTISAYIELLTGLRYGFNRGSKKLFPFSESDTTSGSDDFFNAACVARLTTIATAFVAGFTDAGGSIWVPVVLSTTYSNLSVNPATLYVAQVVGATVSGRCGSMRHRKVKSLL
jgi:hypothetical protein